MSRIGTLLWKISFRATGFMAKVNGLPPTKMFKGETFRIYPRIFKGKNTARERADLLHEKGFGIIIERKKGKRIRGYCLYVKGV